MWEMQCILAFFSKMGNMDFEEEEILRHFEGELYHLWLYVGFG